MTPSQSLTAAAGSDPSQWNLKVLGQLGVKSLSAVSLCLDSLIPLPVPGSHGGIGTFPTTVAFSPTGDYAVSGGADGAVKVWSVELKHCSLGPSLWFLGCDTFYPAPSGHAPASRGEKAPETRHSPDRVASLGVEKLSSKSAPEVYRASNRRCGTS